MKQIRILSIYLVGALAIAPALSGAGAPDQWGQSPEPEVKAKVDEAVKLSATDLLAAERLLTEARDAAPEYYRAQLNLGLIKLSLNSNKEAAEELKKALALQKKLPKPDLTIYAELGFANHRADRPIAATSAFCEGAKIVDKLPPSEQKKLLLRGISFYLDYQQIQAARNLVSEASKSLNKETSAEVQKFLGESVARLTQNDPIEGWIKYGKETNIANQKWQDVLVEKDNAPPGIPKANEIVTATKTIYMREGPMRTENMQLVLARQTGFARIGERFIILEAQPIQLADGSGNSWWIKVHRKKFP